MLNKFFEDKNIDRNFSTFDKYVFEQLNLNKNKINPFHTGNNFHQHIAQIKGKKFFTKRRICYCNYHGSSLVDQKVSILLVQIYNCTFVLQLNSLEEKEAINRYLKVNYNGGQKQDVLRAVQNVIYKQIYTFVKEYDRNLASEKVKRLQELEDLFYMVPKYDGLVEVLKEEQNASYRESIIQEQKNMILNGQCYYCQTTHANKYYEVTPNPAETVVICEECAAMNHPEVLSFNKNPTQTPEDLMEKKKKRQEAQVKRLQTLQAKKLLKQKEEKGDTIKSSKNEKSTSKQDKDEEDDDSDLSESQKECNWEDCWKKNKSNPEDTLICKNCHKSFHAECCDPPLEKAIVSKYDWYCTECKLCVCCQKNTKENELLMCDCCDRPFHMTCLNPPRTDIPEGRWFCKDCEKCASCGVFLFQKYTPELLKQYSKQQVEKQIICNDCWVYYKQKKYCPCCYKIIEENAKGSFVYCDTCELWLHYECEKKLSNKTLREISKQKQFCCSKCRIAEENRK